MTRFQVGDIVRLRRAQIEARRPDWRAVDYAPATPDGDVLGVIAARWGPSWPGQRDFVLHRYRQRFYVTDSGPWMDAFWAQVDGAFVAEELELVYRPPAPVPGHWEAV